ncbi:DUF4234 domain-containing protein [Microbacterium sp. STN6]|uniref:DUF4234 domain-containing protein n=1 Tax=Microbacterium sp. STN6 TaxID=2995588 RepID=UPI003A59985A
MKRRSAAAVFFLPIITLGIYWLVWLAKTRGELKGQGAAVPTTWLYIVPIVSFWWLWKFSAGVTRVTGGSTGASFVLLLLLGSLGGAIVQSGMNRRSDTTMSSTGLATASV